MQHIQETTTVFPFLYYQRIFVKGYIVLAVPTIIAMTSDIAKGYIYIRRRTKGLRIRDLNNAFIRNVSGEAPTGVRENPVRDVVNSISADARARGRDELLTWVYTKDDLPRIINEETYTEFLACVPVKNRHGPPIGNFNLISTYFSDFIDWYRMVTGDISITGPGHWNAQIPMHYDCLIDIRDKTGRPIDEIVQDIDPSHFNPLMFHIDLEPNETGSANATSAGIPHEQRIANFLARGKTVPVVHKRFADILHLAQETKDWALVALAMFPVFEQFFDEYIKEVCARNLPFDSFVTKKRRGRKVVYIGERIGWIADTLTHLGFDAASGEPYFRELKEANEERVQVVHFNKRPTFEDSMKLARVLTNAVLLFEAALGRETAYVVPLVKLDTTKARSE